MNIQEVLGVPNFMDDTSELVKNYVINFISSLSRQNERVTEGNYQTTFNDEFHIGEYMFHNLEFILEITKHDDQAQKPIYWYGAALYDQTKLKWNKKGKLRFVKSSDPDTVTISVELKVYTRLLENLKWNTVYNYAKENERDLIKNIVHELKHAYDTYMMMHVGEKASSKIKYSITNDNKSYYNNYLKIFFYNLYFFDSIENLVRPTEFYQTLVNEGITKRQFLQQFKNFETLKYIKLVENMDYNDISRGTDPKILKKAYDEFVELATNSVIEHAASNLYEKTILKSKAFKSFISLSTRLTYDDMMKDIEMFESKKWGKEAYPYFYKYQLSKMKKNADKVKRKLAKIYALLPG